MPRSVHARSNRLNPIENRTVRPGNEAICSRYLSSLGRRAGKEYPFSVGPRNGYSQGVPISLSTVRSHRTP